MGTDLPTLPSPSPVRAAAAGRIRHGALWVLVATVLGLVFAAWLQPDMAFALASRAWPCF